MSSLSHPKTGRPFEIVRRIEAGRALQFSIRTDLLRLPGGDEVPYVVVTNPDSVFVVPHFEGGDTVLVRQWRHAWDESSWEVPAGTMNAGEEPLDCARRELGEEAGLHAATLSPLGTIHGSAILTGRALIFLAEGITESERKPENYEMDMEVLRLPMVEAVRAAIEGEIVHAVSIAALTRAGRTLGLL